MPDELLHPKYGNNIQSQPALIATFVCPEGLRLSVALDRDLLPPHNLFYRSFDCLRDVGEKEATGSLGCRTYMILSLLRVGYFICSVRIYNEAD